jgi:hypothetical protein
MPTNSRPISRVIVAVAVAAVALIIATVALLPATPDDTIADREPRPVRLRS